MHCCRFRTRFHRKDGRICPERRVSAVKWLSAAAASTVVIVVALLVPAVLCRLVLLLLCLLVLAILALLLLTVLAFNLAGDGLRDAFDPKMKR